MKVVRTEQAWRRLSQIAEFVARDRPAAAAKLVDKLIDRADKLAAHVDRVLLHVGWGRRLAPLLNLRSALTFLAGGLVAYAASFRRDVRFLLPFAAGNFPYIAASDLVPEVNRHHGPYQSALHFVSLLGGVPLQYASAVADRP